MSCIKRISMLTGLKQSPLACKSVFCRLEHDANGACQFVFYRPEHNANGGSHELNFDDLKMQK